MAKYKVEITGVNTSSLKVLSNEEQMMYFKKMREGDAKAKEILIEGNLKLVLSVLKSFRNFKGNMDDLFQVGVVGLIKAIDNFDASLNLKLSTYAIPLILGEVKKFLRSNQSSVRVSRGMKDFAYQILNYKEQYFQKYGLKTFFVGHPALQNVVGDKNRFLEKYNFKNTDTIITLLPGTRQQMAEKLLPIFSDVVDNLRETIPNLKVVIPTIKNMEYFIFDKTRFWKVDPLIITGKQNRYDAFFASDVALAISGTSVLELAISKTPTVVAYKLSPITYAIAKHLVKIQNVTLPNIIMGKRIIPEFIQDECNAENLTKAILKILMNKEYKKHYTENYEKMIDKLSGESPTSSSDKAAEVILGLLK